MIPAKTVGFVIAENPRTARQCVGLVTSDGRCRINTAANENLYDFTLWEANWSDPKNPWAGGTLTGKQVTNLQLDYT